MKVLFTLLSGMLFASCATSTPEAVPQVETKQEISVHAQACQDFRSWSKEEIGARKASSFQNLAQYLASHDVPLTESVLACTVDYVESMWSALASNCGADPLNPRALEDHADLAWAEFAQCGQRALDAMGQQ